MIVIEPPSRTTAAPVRVSARELQQFLARAKRAIPLAGSVSVLLTSDAAVRELNRRFRGVDKATDVISFPAADQSGLRRRLAGDVAISLETAGRQAAEFEHSIRVEIRVLMLHGLLHLAGLDHEADEGEMAERELELRTELGLPVGLIERVSGKSLNPVTKTRVPKARPGAPASLPAVRGARTAAVKRGGAAR